MPKPKITGATLDKLREAIKPFDTPERRERYKTGDFINSKAVIDLNKRYRWDLFYIACSWRIFGDDETFEGMTDAHIYTALKSIIPDITE